MNIKKTNFLLLISLSSISIALSKIGNNLLNVEELYYQSLTVNLPAQQVERIFEVQKKIQWFNYVIVPIITLIKTMIISSIIYIGIMMLSDNKKISFSLLWYYILNAEFIFVLANISKIIWFYFFQIDYNLDDLQFFYPLSLLNIIDYRELDPWFIYPFQIINIFELGYWFLLAYYIGKITQTNIDIGLKIMLNSYGPALLLWLVTVMFITLNI